MATTACHQVMYGGTNATSDIRALQQRTPDILVSRLAISLFFNAHEQKESLLIIACCCRWPHQDGCSTICRTAACFSQACPACACLSWMRRTGCWTWASGAACHSWQECQRKRMRGWLSCFCIHSLLWSIPCLFMPATNTRVPLSAAGTRLKRCCACCRRATPGRACCSA